MKVIVLTAGYGTRLRPHTYSRPKPLIEIAGKPVIAHILDPLAEALAIDEIICVYGYLGQQIEGFLANRYDFPVRFIEQADPKGQAHAIHLCREFVDGPALIVFGDGLFAADFSQITDHPEQGAIYVQPVEDPSRFGVVVVEDGRITRLVEKPDTPVSNLAVIGVYYVPQASALMDAIGYCMEQNIQTKGEYYLADALEVMLQRGAHFVPQSVSMWQDAGTVPAVIETHRYLLDHGHQRDGSVSQSTIIPPVHIAEGAVVERSVIGPYTTIAAGAVVRDSIISDSIINARATVEAAHLRGSLIGAAAHVSGHAKTLNIGETSQVEIG